MHIPSILRRALKEPEPLQRLSGRHDYPWLVVATVCIGAFIGQLDASVMAAAPAKRLGVAGGLINMMRGLGASFGVALVSVILAFKVGPAPTHTVHPGRVVDGIRIALSVLIVASVLAGILSLRHHRPPDKIP